MTQLAASPGAPGGQLWRPGGTSAAQRRQQRRGWASGPGTADLSYAMQSLGNALLGLAQRIPLEVALWPAPHSHHLLPFHMRGLALVQQSSAPYCALTNIRFNAAHVMKILTVCAGWVVLRSARLWRCGCR